MQQNLISNPYLKFTLADLLFEKGSVLEPIANNQDLSAARRADALSKMVQIEDVLLIFEAAAQMGLYTEVMGNVTAVQLVEQVTGKTLAELSQGPTIAAIAGHAVGSGARKMKGWLNKGAEWIVEKTK